jgi:hypothetical protein
MTQIAARILGDFLRMVDERHRDSPVQASQLRALQQTYLASAQFAAVLHQAHSRLLDAAAHELLRQKRSDPFHRLLVHPFTEVLEDGRLSRDLLVNYFSLLHLVLGDARDRLSDQCSAILDELRDPDALAFSWDSFYQDSRAKQVLWQVLVRIAESFRRFELRREWFIGLMQNRPQAVSLGTSAFLPRHMSEPSQQFGVAEFNLMFGRLYAPLRDLSGAEAAAFERQFGASPEQLLGSFFAELEASGAAI